MGTNALNPQAQREESKILTTHLGLLYNKYLIKKNYIMNNNIKVEVPDNFNQNYLNPFFESLYNVQDEEEVIIDFSQLSYSFPMGMLVFGSYLRRWAITRKENGFRTSAEGIDTSKSVHNYLMHLGFFKFIRINLGKAIGEASGSNTYIPIRQITRTELENYARENNEQLVDAIEFESRSLAFILAGSNQNSQDITTYSYAIREILRNVFEHSGIDKCFLCGQRWYDGSSEIAIVDEGVGIYETIKQAYSVSNAEEAIQLAIQPGITRAISLSEQENIYNNSGYGLYVLSELGNSFGWFCIGSDSAKLTYKSKNKYVEPFNFQGTFIGVHLDRTPFNFKGVLDDIICEGEQEALSKGRLNLASSISKSLSYNQTEQQL